MILIVHVAATWFMVGLIWFVQIVHYPLFARIGEASFPEYERGHRARTTIVVLPPMLVELATALWLVAQPLPGIPAWQAWSGAGLVGLIWLSTFGLQVPAHTTLLRGWRRSAHRALVGTNWLRTVLWTTRGILVATWL